MLRKVVINFYKTVIKDQQEPSSLPDLVELDSNLTFTGLTNENFTKKFDIFMLRRSNKQSPHFNTHIKR